MSKTRPPTEAVDGALETGHFSLGVLTDKCDDDRASSNNNGDDDTDGPTDQAAHFCADLADLLGQIRTDFPNLLGQICTNLADFTVQFLPHIVNSLINVIETLVRTVKALVHAIQSAFDSVERAKHEQLEAHVVLGRSCRLRSSWRLMWLG